MGNIVKIFNDYEKSYQYTRKLFEDNLNTSDGKLFILPRVSERDLNIVIYTNHPVFLTAYYIISLNCVCYCENEICEPYYGCALHSSGGFNEELELTEEHILDMINMLNTECSIWRKDYMFNMTTTLRNF